MSAILPEELIRSAHDGLPPSHRRLASRDSWKPYIHQAIQSLPSGARRVLRQVIENDVASLQRTLASLSLEVFERAVKALRKAPTICFT